LVEVVQAMGEAGIAIDDVALRRPTLDDVFLTLTGHHTADENVEESA
jgi:ABC-2 type transport system ATP-binding protein